jgi:hypothetical protein
MGQTPQADVILSGAIRCDADRVLGPAQPMESRGKKRGWGGWGP